MDGNHRASSVKLYLFGKTQHLGIAGELVEGAQRLAVRAMRSYAQSDHEVSALQAGVSIERLAKWALASRSPVLIADMQQGNKSFKHLLHLSEVKKEPAKDLRTVGLGGALDRLRDLGVFTPKEREDLNGLVNRRNGVVHVADSEVEDPEVTMAEFINTAERLLEDGGEGREWFWGDQLALVDEVRAQADRAIERALHLRIQVARSRYRDHVRGIAPEALAAWAEAARDRVRRFAAVSAPFGVALATIHCPACGNPALVVYDLRSASSAEPVNTEANFRKLDCQICGFEMRDRTELAPAGVDLTRAELLDAFGARRGETDPRWWSPQALSQAELELYLTLDHDEQFDADLQYIEDEESEEEEQAMSEGESYEP